MIVVSANSIRVAKSTSSDAGFRSIDPPPPGGEGRTIQGSNSNGVSLRFQPNPGGPRRCRSGNPEARPPAIEGVEDHFAATDKPAVDAAMHAGELDVGAEVPAQCLQGGRTVIGQFDSQRVAVGVGDFVFWRPVNSDAMVQFEDLVCVRGGKVVGTWSPIGRRY